MNHVRIGLGCALTLLAALATPPASGHGGEDHGAPPVTSQPLLPRAAAESPDFEIVGVLEPGRIVFYLDRHASNEPVAGARVSVEGAFAGSAAETAPGVYALALAAAPPAGHHALTLAIETATDADLLGATLDVPAPADAAAEEGVGGSALGAAGYAALAGAAVLGAIAMRARRRRTANHDAGLST